MTLHNYRSRQVHETLNGVNPSSSFRDMRSAKSGPNLWQIWQVFGPWASPYGANGHMTMTVHTYRPRQFHRTSNGENPSSGYRDMGSASLAAARPPARTVTTIPLQPGGLRGKKVRQAQPDRQDRQTEWQTIFFLKENPFENVICKMLAILFQAWIKLIFHQGVSSTKAT